MVIALVFFLAVVDLWIVAYGVRMGAGLIVNKTSVPFVIRSGQRPLNRAAYRVNRFANGMMDVCHVVGSLMGAWVLYEGARILSDMC